MVDRTPVPSDADENLEPAVKRRKVTRLFHCLTYRVSNPDPDSVRSVDLDPDP